MLKHYQVDVQQRGPGMQNYRSHGRMTVQAENDDEARELADAFITKTRAKALERDPAASLMVVVMLANGEHGV